MNLEAFRVNNFAEACTVLSTVVAIIGLPLIIRQLWVAERQRLEAIKLSGSQVLLAVDAVLAAYQQINVNLGLLGDWHRSSKHPDVKELRDAEPYLGAFERLWIAFTIGQIDIKTINHLYGYRLRNIWVNPRLVEDKLQNKETRDGWSMLIALTYALELEIQKGKRFEGHTDNFQPPEWQTWLEQKKSSECAPST
jgi:hypothetical protein